MKINVICKILQMDLVVQGNQNKHTDVLYIM